MKKVIMVVAVLAMVAVGVQADYFTAFYTGYGISDAGNNPLLLTGEQGLVQLIYVGANGVADAASIGGAVTGDDQIIISFLSPAAVAGDWFTEFGIWGTILVNTPFLEPNGSNVIGRIFQDSDALAGTFYYDGHVQGMKNLNPLAVPPPTAESYNLGLDSVALANLVVIPEPATLGMIGVAAIGLFITRKKYIKG